MSFTKAFISSESSYPVEAPGSVIGPWAQLLPNMQIYCNADSFPAKAYDIFRPDTYTLTFYNRASISKWQNSLDVTYYQNQLNMAVFLATSGCGVSVNDHLLHKDPFVASFFRFHTYYQIRKVLHQMGCPIPGDDNFNKLNNRIVMTRYVELGSEFDLPHHPDFRYRGGNNHGLGTIYLWGKPMHGNSYVNHNSSWYFSNESPSFASRYRTTKIDKLEQTDAGWMAFMLQDGKGFTRAGIIRLNDSIRTYVYCILGSQAQTRAPILGAGGTSLDAQKQFLVLLEDCINQSQSLSLPDMIKRYEDAITQTHKRLNYAMAPNLYMIPSDLVLKMGIKQGYNNNITVATADMKFGMNEVNGNKIITNKSPALSASPSKVNRLSLSTPAPPKMPLPMPQPTPPKVPLPTAAHENNKVYLTVGLVVVFGVAVIYFKQK